MKHTEISYPHTEDLKTTLRGHDRAGRLQLAVEPVAKPGIITSLFGEVDRK